MVMVMMMMMMMMMVIEEEDGGQLGEETKGKILLLHRSKKHTNDQDKKHRKQCSIRSLESRFPHHVRLTSSHLSI